MHKRNLKRHIKEMHNDSEHWNCVEEGCSSRFIRRSYLSKHLVWIHGYNQDDAIEAVLSAPREDKPKQYGEFEGDSILDLLAERDATLKSSEFYDKIEDFNTDFFDQQTTSTAADTSFDAMCDIDIEVCSRENQADIIEAFNSTSRYLDDLLNIDNIYFDQMVDRIYPTELQLNRANSSDTEAPFLDLNLCISNGTVSTKIYDKRDDFDFDLVNFPFLDGDVPRRTSYGVYISQLIRFARASSNLNDFNYRNKALTAKLLMQGYRYFKLRQAFSKFYRRHSALLEKCSVCLKTLLQQGISEPEFYGDLVYRFRKTVGKSNFSEQFRKLINRYKRIGYSLDIMRQTACLVVNPIIVDGYASLFNCTTAVRA